ncbi:MAG: hypothetical protein KIS92_09480 [Planctomycetota bacterium]|nr:hypothetical protein [Planctomycetota bacterium]
MHGKILAVALLAAAFANGARAATLKPTNDGVHIDAGGMGGFTLTWPELQTKDRKKSFKPIDKTIAGMKAVLKYANGAQATVDVKGGEVALHFDKVPGEVDTYKAEMFIGQQFNQGGFFKAGGGEKTPFPAEQPKKAQIYQGHADSLELTSVDGAVLTIEVPKYTYQQVQDNREWGWKVNVWLMHTPLNGKDFTYRVTGSGEDKTVVLMDRFGQNARAEWPGKVHSEDELKKDAEDEKAYYAGFRPPERDVYGGLPGSGEKLGLTKTGFFHVERKNGRWHLVDPAGNAFFHLGVCAFQSYQEATYYKGREKAFEWLPPKEEPWNKCYRGWNNEEVTFLFANFQRKYGKIPTPKEFTLQSIDRVRLWGFNSTGAFGSGDREARNERNFPSVGSLPFSKWEGVPEIPGVRCTWDPFDEKMQKAFDANCAKHIAPHADDPLIIGYFLTNEPIYEDIPRVIPTLKGEWACKRRLVAELKKKYGTIEAFNQAWDLKAASFDALNDQGLGVKTDAAAGDIKDFTALFLDELFRTATETFRKYDKNHMLIGNRLQFGTINNETLCKIGGKYMDVWSFNYYTYALDTEFLKRVHGWSGGKPMILSEFYWNAVDESGLPGGVKDVKTQAERGLAYRQYVEQAAALDFIVGVEWYTLYDMPYTGVGYSKLGGENANDGLLAMTDRPWKDMLAHMVKTNYEIYDVIAGTRKPFVFDDPRFTVKGPRKQTVKVHRAEGPMEIDGTSAGWPGIPAERIGGDRLVNGADAGGVEATFKLCWDDANLYVLAEVTDPTPLKNEQGEKSLWSADCVELFFGADKPGEGGELRRGDRQVLLRAAVPSEGKASSYVPQLDEQPAIKSAVVARVDGKGYVLEAAIPFALLGVEKPDGGRELLFDIAIDDSADGKIRARQLMWNGSLNNSKDRGAWGRAVLVK